MHPQGAADTIRIELLHVGSRNVSDRMPDLAPCGEAILFLLAMSFVRGGWYLLVGVTREGMVQTLHLYAMSFVSGILLC